MHHSRSWIPQLLVCLEKSALSFAFVELVVQSGCKNCFLLHLGTSHGALQRQVRLITGNESEVLHWPGIIWLETSSWICWKYLSKASRKGFNGLIMTSTWRHPGQRTVMNNWQLRTWVTSLPQSHKISQLVSRFIHESDQPWSASNEATQMFTVIHQVRQAKFLETSMILDQVEVQNFSLAYCPSYLTPCIKADLLDLDCRPARQPEGMHCICACLTWDYLGRMTPLVEIVSVVHFVYCHRVHCGWSQAILP